MVTTFASLDVLMLGDIQEVVGTLLGLIFLVFWVIGQLAGDKKKPAAQSQRQQRPQPPQARQRAAPAPPDQAELLRRDMDEFLRKAEGKEANERRTAARRAQPSARPGQEEAEVELLLDNARLAEQSQRDRTTPRKVKQASLKRLSGEEVTLRQSVADHTVSAIGSRSFRERTSHLGEQVARADDKLESRLHTTFDHTLGRLVSGHADQAYREHVKTNETAGRIAELLSHPDGVCQAVILNEILQPHADRL